MYPLKPPKQLQAKTLNKVYLYGLCCNIMISLITEQNLAENIKDWTPDQSTDIEQGIDVRIVLQHNDLFNNWTELGGKH